MTSRKRQSRLQSAHWAGPGGRGRCRERMLTSRTWLPPCKSAERHSFQVPNRCPVPVSAIRGARRFWASRIHSMTRSTTDRPKKPSPRTIALHLGTDRSDLPRCGLRSSAARGLLERDPAQSRCCYADARVAAWARSASTAITKRRNSREYALMTAPGALIGAAMIRCATVTHPRWSVRSTHQPTARTVDTARRALRTRRGEESHDRFNSRCPNCGRTRGGMA